MRRLKQILVPTDFSERSVAAARYAKTLARHFDARIILLYAVPRDHYAMVPMDAGIQLFPERVEEARQGLQRFLVTEFPDSAVETVLLDGDPAQKIVEYARAQEVDLIVMPTHGYGPFRRFLLGSVTAKVLHDADCPVLTGVHLEESPEVQSIHSGRIVCAVDLGPHAPRVLEWAAGMAGEFDARLTLVHAIPQLEAHDADYFDPNWRQFLTNLASDHIAKLQQEVGTHAEVLIESGETPRVVRCAALRLRAGLAVIGRGSSAGDLRAPAGERLHHHPRVAVPGGKRVALPDMTRLFAVLVVSPRDEDHAFLRRMCRGGAGRCYLLKAQCCGEAIALTRCKTVPIILSERELPDGSWKDLWEQIGRPDRDRRPALIVTSVKADSSLWAEVLNVGGYDVLVKPLDEQEILHVLGRACEQMDRPAGTVATAA